MIRSMLLAAAAALLATGVQAQAPAAKAPAAKAAPKAAPTKAAPRSAPVKAPPAKAAPAQGFDAGSPQSLAALLTGLGAQASVAERVEDAVALKVASPAGDFRVQFAGCNASGRACQAVQFDAAAQQRTATLQQVNGFNQSSMMCRIYQDRTGKPHVLYATLVSGRMNRADMETHLRAWQGCLAEFGAFLKDPNGYLAAAP